MGSGFIRGKGPGTQVKSAIASNVIILNSIARRAFLKSLNNAIATRIKKRVTRQIYEYGLHFVNPLPSK